MPLVLTNTDNENQYDAPGYYMLGAFCAETVVVGGVTYVAVVGAADQGVSVFRLNANGTLTSVFNLADAGNSHLTDLYSIRSANVAGVDYLYVSGNSNGITALRIDGDGSLTPVSDVATAAQLGSYANETATVGGITYLYVSSYWENGVRIFSIGAGGALTQVGTVNDADNPAYKLAGATGLESVVVGGTTLLLATSYNDDGLNVFRVETGGQLTFLNAVGGLDGSVHLTTAVVGGQTYVYATSGDGAGGVSVFSLASDGALAAVQTVADDDTILLRGAQSVEVFTVAGVQYLAVGGTEDGLTLFRIGSSGTLTLDQNIFDNDTVNLSPYDYVTSTVVGGVPFLIGVGSQDSGLSIFKMSPPNAGPVITGLQGDTVTITEDVVQQQYLDVGANAAISDPDSGNFNGGSLTSQITSGFANFRDRLAVIQDGIVTLGGSTAGSAVFVSGVRIGSLGQANGQGDTISVLFDTDNATAARVEALLHRFGFVNSSQDPVAGPRTVTTTLVDGDGVASGGVDRVSYTTSVNVVASNDAPVISPGSGTASFIEGANVASAPVVVASGIAISDVDSARLASATASITGNFATGQDVLAFTNTSSTSYGNITANYDGGTGVLTLTSAGSTATTGQFTSALRAITYTNSSDTPGTATRTISFVVNDGEASSAARTRDVTVTAANDSPIISNLQGDVATQAENVSSSAQIDTGSNATVTDADSADFAGGALTIKINSPYNGEDLIGISGNGIASVSGSDVSISGIVIGTVTGGAYGNSPTDTLTVTFNADATPARVALLVQAVFISDPRAEPEGGTRSLLITLMDGDGGSRAYSSAFVVNAANDEPAGADKTIVTGEDGAYALTVADFGFDDNASTPFSERQTLLAVKITAPPTLGTLYLDTDGAGTGGLGTPITVGQSVSAADIGAGRLVFVPAANGNGTGYSGFDFQVQDNGGTANGIDLDQSANRITFDVTPANDAPVVDLNTSTVGVNDSKVYSEGGVASGIGTTIAVTDVDGDTIHGATVTLTDPVTGDMLVCTTLPDGISVDPASTLTNLILVGNAGAGAYADALSQVGFRNSGDDPTSGGTDTSRTITVTVNDGLVDSAPATTTITVSAFDDAPVANFAPVGGDYQATEDVTLDLKGTVSLADADTAGALIQVMLQVGTGTLFVDAGTSGVDVTTYSGHQILLYGSIAQINDLLNSNGTSAVTFTADEVDAPPATTTFAVIVYENVGFQNPLYYSDTIAIIPVNDAPYVVLDIGGSGLDDAGSYAENGTPAPLGADIYVGDPDSAAIHGATITITDPSAGDRLSADLASDGGIMISSASTATTLILVGTASGPAYQNALRQVRYTNDGDDPTAAGANPDRVITVTVNDGEFDSPPATMTLAITAEDDAAIAQPDAVSTDEATVKTGSVFSNNGAGADADPDSPLVVTAIEGSAKNVGHPVTLASGARVTLNADGTFSYDPNHKFDDTAAPGSGASNSEAHDSFTYAVNGVTTTVSLTITGIDGNDVLRGTSGSDMMSGGAGDDRYFVDQAGDLVLENSGQGYDRVLASVSYVLPTGSEIERLTTDDNFSTAPINLTGNEFAQYLFGNAGANILDGAGGADVMVGFGGDDRYYVDTAADRVVEAAGEGYDRVLAAVSWTLQAGSQVEKITTIDNLATTAINLTGNDLSQYIFGNAGANILDGGGGGDVLVGLGGDDRYIIRNSADRVIEEAAGGNDRVLAGASFVLQPGSEVETLSTIDNLGTTAIDLAGNELGQYLFGNAGANVLDGKLGNDVLYGLDGSDTFQFTTVPGANNVDRIADFVTGVDRIALDDFIFTGLQAGTLNANAFHVGSAAHDADDRIIYNQTTGALYFDYDGNGHGAAVQFASLNGAPILAASDFQII